MYIVQIASEMAPIAKVGGLADVMMGLSRELKWKGLNVEIVIPKYDCLDTRGLQQAVFRTDVRSYFNGGLHENTIWKGRMNGDLSMTLIESHHHDQFFNRGCIYGCHDDVDRFLYFSRAVCDYLLQEGVPPDVMHIHDWPTACIAFLIRDGSFRKFFEKTKVVFTIHNMEYQGRCSTSDIEKIGVLGAHYDSPVRLQDEFSPCLNLLKGGIVFSDKTITVSPTYAKEVLFPEGGKGLQGVLLENSDKFCGILNGVDYSYWNPEVDPHIYQLYTKNTLSVKKENKSRLLEDLKMAKSENRPLVCAITRLVQQKGIELIKHAIYRTLEKGGQFILLGTAPDPQIHWEFSELQEELMHNDNVKIFLHHEETLAHRIFAASDIFIVPSIFEPCGLTQIIAMKYGAIPVVRKTGGLADTVFDVDTKPFEKANGFVFETKDYKGMDYGLDRALEMFTDDQKTWKKLMLQAMSCDYSWNKPATRYIEMYL